ncbi:hypothetical protein [Hominifimenecus sp. rT4P-3]|uniref:hypothetical protein n=1 Tax=Hominifimenecus sp. rT4P-3 TaxID=3242979 RepID=UPI003DA5649D
MTLKEKIAILEADNERLRRENQRLAEGHEACRTALRELREVLQEAQEIKRASGAKYREILAIREDWKALVSEERR